MPDALHDAAGELTLTLLHQPDTYATENFNRVRHGALVALAVHSPMHAISVLTQQFHGHGLGLAQRWVCARVARTCCSSCGAVR